MYAFILPFLISILGMQANGNLTVTLQSDKGKASTITVTTEHIQGYDWVNHEVVLKEHAVAQLKQYPIKYQSFTLKVCTQQIYTGIFQKDANSQPNQPSILLQDDQTIALHSSNRIKIVYSGKDDMLNNTVLKEYLEKKNLLL